MKTLPTLVALGAALAASQGPRNLLTGGLSEPTLAAALVPAAQWHPYPTIRDRADWEAAPQEMRAGFIQQSRQELSPAQDGVPTTGMFPLICTGDPLTSVCKN